VSGLRFSKMHGAGNDFVVLDLRGDGSAPSPDLSRALADRHRGIGCDQILTIERARDPAHAADYRIWNADGSPAQQCGNGARCVAAWLQRDGAARGERFLLGSPAGTVEVRALGGGRYRLALGVPEFAPARIPLHGFADEQDQYLVDLDEDHRLAFGAASMGNPHALVEVKAIEDHPVARQGQLLQDSAWFPESVNVGFAQVVDRARIRLRVFERGVGETLACGSGACAAVAILVRQDRVDRDVVVELPGGSLRIEWPDDASPVYMSGPTAFVFEGEWAA
jgi:diaminopimelate epimerase